MFWSFFSFSKYVLFLPVLLHFSPSIGRTKFACLTKRMPYFLQYWHFDTLRCLNYIVHAGNGIWYYIYHLLLFFCKCEKLPFLRSTLVKDIREVPVLYCHRRTIKLQKFQALKHHEIYAGAQTICLQIITKLLLEYDECMQRYGRGHEWNDCISYILHLRNELWMENQNSLIFQIFAKVSLLFLYKALRGRFVPQLVVFHQILTLLDIVHRDCSLYCSKIRSFLAILSFSNPFSSFS